MNINITAKPLPVRAGDFCYGNLPSRYGVNTRYITKDGKPYTVIAGELHFSRLPRSRWRETLLKMRALGVNTVSTYVFWNYHEEKKGQFNFSGNRNIGAFLALCRELGMPCILRIGPWCHGEVVLGGLPKRIHKMPKKRSDDPAYLQQVHSFWTRLCHEIKPYLDGETVIGIQLENEYTGPTTHLLTLRRLAEEIGFQTPFFTMTAWPSGKPDRHLLPMMGGYPDAPWARGKTALKPNNRFAITKAKTEEEIGADLHTNQTGGDSAFDKVPYAFCEIGPGNQVTQHRRPYISEKDGWGVGFAKFASGAVWLGYYMFCGGANPNDRPMQESRLTGYPNDYPIINYDFQAPISRYGVVRAHGHRLRLMHLFIQSFDPAICKKAAYFPRWPSNDPTDFSFLKCSIRADDTGSGYFFAGNYEKNGDNRDFAGVRVCFTQNGTQTVLPPVDVARGAMFFYPFRLTLGSVFFDYILAQPIAKTTHEGQTVCYFMACEGVPPRCRTNGQEMALPLGRTGTVIGDVRLVVLSETDAKRFYLFGGVPYFADGTVYADGERIVCEQAKQDLTGACALQQSERQKLPYGYYLYSTGKRAYYTLRLPKDVLKDRFDVRLTFQFDGLNLQVFSGDTLVNDSFNIDGRFVMHLRDFRAYLEKSPVLTIRAVPRTKVGISHVYCEKPIPLHETRLRLLSAEVITRSEGTLQAPPRGVENGLLFL